MDTAPPPAPAPARWFMEPPSATTVVSVLQAVALLLLVLPLDGAVLLAGPHVVRSLGALWVGAGLLVLAALALLRDVGRLRRGAFADFRPWAMVLEISSLTGVGACATVAFGTRHGMMVLATCVPCLAAPIVGGTAVVAVSWLGLVAAVAVETGLQLPAGSAVTVTAAFAGTVGIYVVALHRVLAQTVVSREVTHALADLAASAGTLRRWPADLRTVAPQLAVTLAVDRYAVLTRRAPHAWDDRPPAHAAGGERLEEAFSWPDGHWGDGAQRLALGARAVSERAVVQDGTCWAVPSLVGDRVDVVLVVPFADRNGQPVDTPMATTAATLLGAMHDRSELVGGLVDLAFTDDLTGLANRRRLMEALRGAVAGAHRTGRPCSVALLDLDRFKDHNDTFGHASGDGLLRRFAHLLEATLAPTDLAARLGGDEFCVVMVGRGADEALRLMQTVRDRWDAGQEATGGVSVSAGVATWPDEPGPVRAGGSDDAAPWGRRQADPGGTVGHVRAATEDDTVGMLLRRADAVLYEAKNAGRDRVVADVPASVDSA